MFGLYKYRYIYITNGSLKFLLDSRLGSWHTVGTSKKKGLWGIFLRPKMWHLKQSFMFVKHRNKKTTLFCLLPEPELWCPRPRRGAGTTCWPSPYPPGCETPNQIPAEIRGLVFTNKLCGLKSQCWYLPSSFEGCDSAWYSPTCFALLKSVLIFTNNSCSLKSGLLLASNFFRVKSMLIFTKQQVLQTITSAGIHQQGL